MTIFQSSFVIIWLSRNSCSFHWRDTRFILISFRKEWLLFVYIILFRDFESERNSRSGKESGVNLHPYGQFRYDIFWWRYANELRTKRGSLTELRQYCTFLGLVETLTAADSPSWPSWKTSTTHTLEVGLKLRSLIRNSTQGAWRYASQESLNSMYWRKKKS